jgi:hypothetical protein
MHEGLQVGTKTSNASHQTRTRFFMSNHCKRLELNPATMPSSKATKRPALTIDTTTPKTEPETPDANVSDAKASSQEHKHQPCDSTTCPTTHRHHHHHDQHDNHQHDHTDSESLKSKSTASFDSDLSTWAHLSVDGPTGGTLRTVCTHDDENGEPCQHVGHERKYPEFPRVDEPLRRSRWRM